MPTIDGGIFMIFIGVAFGSLFMGNVVKFGFVFKLVGAFLFFALGLMMNAEYDVAYTTTIANPNANQSNINQTLYIIGNGSGGNEMSSFLGWLFIGLALLWVGLFLMDVMKMSGW